jgi:outer membrane protein assembly factor BamD (BamD/ComL family)
LKKNAFFLSVIVTLFVFFGCADKAKEKFETARFEELQTNFPHAKKLYKSIIENYPESEYASQARDRLEIIKDKN